MSWSVLVGRLPLCQWLGLEDLDFGQRPGHGLAKTTCGQRHVLDSTGYGATDDAFMGRTNNTGLGSCEGMSTAPVLLVGPHKPHLVHHPHST